MPLDLSAADDWAPSEDAQHWAEAAKKEKSIGKAPYVVMSGGQLADLLSTVVALQQPGLKEGNPLMGQSPARMALMKGGVGAGVGLLMRHADKKGHDKLAKGVGYAMGLVGAALAAHNLRQMQKAKERR